MDHIHIESWRLEPALKASLSLQRVGGHVDRPVRLNPSTHQSQSITRGHASTWNAVTVKARRQLHPLELQNAIPQVILAPQDGPHSWPAGAIICWVATHQCKTEQQQ